MQEGDEREVGFPERKAGRTIFPMLPAAEQSVIMLSYRFCEFRNGSMIGFFC